MKNLIFTLAFVLALPAIAEEKVCQIPLNTEKVDPDGKNTYGSELNPDPSMLDSFANLTSRLGDVISALADQERKDARDPKKIQARDTFTYGKGANVLQAGDLRRAFHAKAHGCVDAELRITYDLSQVEGIGSDIGIFNKNADGTLPTYSNAIVRLSNARGQMQDDNADDLRGFALKLKGVEGPRADSRAQDERDTQDFLFTNAPVHFAKDAPEMVRFAEFMLNPLGKLIKGLFWPPSWKKTFEAMGNAIKASKDIKENRTGSVLTARYYSRVPFMVGKKAAKFSVTPAPCDWTPGEDLTPYSYVHNPEPTPQPKWLLTEDKLNPHYLREEMKAHLNPQTGSDVCFDFNVQFQVDACKQPIENASVEWKREEAPVIRVGQVRIPKQVFAGTNGQPSKKDYMCETIAYNPWHALKAHQPLGNMNRAREHVYYELQKSRNRW